MSNRAFEIRSRIESQLSNKAQLDKHQARLMSVLTHSFSLTFLLYLAFTITLYLGDVMLIKTMLSSWGEIPGFIFYLIIASLLAFVLAKIKHLTYLHGSMFGNSIIIVAMLIVTGVVFESFQTATQQDMKARKTAEASTEHQNAVNADPLAGLNTEVNTDKLAFYEGKLATHKRYKEGCVKTCAAQDAAIADYTAKVKVEEQRISNATTLTKDLAVIGTTAKQDAIAAAERKGYNLMARAFSDMSGTTIAQGVAFLMILVSTLFEGMHFWASLMLAKVLRSLQEVEGQLLRLYIDYQNETGYEFGNRPADKAPEETVKDAPIENKTNDKSFVGFQPSKPAIATALATNQAQAHSTVDKPMFKYQTRDALPQAKVFGFAGTTSKEQTKPAALRVTQPSAIEMPTKEPSVINAPQPSVISKPEPSVKTTTEGIKDPRPRVSEGSEDIDINALYGNWSTEISNGGCKPSVTASWKWLQQRISKSQAVKKAPTPQYMTEIVQLFIRRALHDGVLIDNPNYRNGLPKYFIGEK